MIKRYQITSETWLHDHAMKIFKNYSESVRRLLCAYILRKSVKEVMKMKYEDMIYETRKSIEN